MSILKQSRNNDYFYDNNFVVSGPKDHYKRAVYAKISTATYAVCPIFPSMFSDLPHYPRKQFVRRKSGPIPAYQEKLAMRSNSLNVEFGADVGGVDRHKFFTHSTISLQAIPKLDLSTSDDKFETSPVKELSRTFCMNKNVQTQYRDSNAQTSPWQPDYTVMDNGDPEILKLDFLKWGSGLPVGMHEIQLIERARMKRDWEHALPPIDNTKKSVIDRANLIACMERDQWAFREHEIQDIQDLRLELLEKMLKELLDKSKGRSEMKLQMFCDMKMAEKNEKLEKLRRTSDREKRRLEWNHKGLISKYHRLNIVDELANRKSEVYAPHIRNGNNPKYWHLKLKKSTYKSQYIGVERMKVVPRWLSEGCKLTDSEVKLPGTRLCIRETKWTTPVLKNLHEELKGLRIPQKKRCTLRTKIYRIPEDPITPEVDAIEEEEEEIYQAALMLEGVLRGRTSQILIFEGRDRCRELIEELRSSHSVLEKDIQEKFENKQEVKKQQREEELCIRNISKVQEALKRLEGSVVGTLLDFLNKELTRLLDERKAHALCLMAERERQIREAAEAGRRQLELRRRNEHDEMFKQIVKVTQDSVDLYLQDIITEGMEFTSNEEAKHFVKTMAVKVDKENAESLLKKDDIEFHEELVADLIHHFVLPEVEKHVVRNKIKLRQSKYLKTAHDEIYNKIDNGCRTNERDQEEKQINENIS